MRCIRGIVLEISKCELVISQPYVFTEWGKNRLHTVCPRRLVPFYVVTYYINRMGQTFFDIQWWIYSFARNIYFLLLSDHGLQSLMLKWNTKAWKAFYVNYLFYNQHIISYHCIYIRWYVRTYCARMKENISFLKKEKSYMWLLSI